MVSDGVPYLQHFWYKKFNQETLVSTFQKIYDTKRQSDIRQWVSDSMEYVQEITSKKLARLIDAIAVSNQWVDHYEAVIYVDITTAATQVDIRTLTPTYAHIVAT